jgi:beta-lactamase class A
LTTDPLSHRSLEECVDSTLQARLRRAVSRKGWADLVADDALAVGVVDLSRPDRPQYAALNGTEMMYAASLPKIGILYAAVRQMEQGQLSPTPEVRADLQSMIRVSSNAAATRMIDRVGGLRAVNRSLRDPDAHLYDREQGGGIWVGKRFSSDARRQPDPIEGLSHGATVYQVARFYTLVATGRLVNRKRSAQMLEALSNPGLDHKFVHVLQRRAPAADVYRKSGSWRYWHADSALVWGPDRRYVLVALVKDEDGGRVVRALLPVVETALGLPAAPSSSWGRGGRGSGDAPAGRHAP